MFRPRADMQMTSRRIRATGRAQTVSMECSFMPSSSWSYDLLEQVSTVLAAALVKDLKQHPIGELPSSALPS